MSQFTDEQRWLDVLAGKVEPRDAEEREAARVRQYFRKEEANLEPLDAATRLRVENLMAAKLAAVSAVSARTAAPGQAWWQRLSNWLMPAGAAPSGRYAAVAAAVVAAVTLSFIIPATLPDADDAGTIKSPADAGIPESVVQSRDPAAESARFLQVLAEVGVAAQILEEGEDRVVQAQVPPDKLIAARDALQAKDGHALPPDGRVRVRFKHNPQ